MRYWVIYETSEEGGWSAYVPDLPGCVAAAQTREEVRRLIREGMALHLAGMREDGEPIPEPADSWAEIVEVSEEAIARGIGVGALSRSARADTAGNSSERGAASPICAS